MPAIINSDSGAITGSAGLKIHGNSDGILEIQNNGVTSLVVANSYIRVPIGNTATRPTVASAGMIRFNNQSNVFEGFNGTSWINISFRSFVANILIVAGGGGGGGFAGGGGGGFRTINDLTITTGNLYSVTVGAGGAPLSTGGSKGGNGTDSVFGAFTSTGGGGGGAFSTTNQNGNDGGSGGGGGTSSVSPFAFGTGGNGTPGQGNSGGNGVTGGLSGGGGGGAGQIGGTGTPTAGGIGGNGSNSTISGSLVTYSGGGGGGGSSGGSGGSGGGGQGGAAPVGTGVANGVTNTGGGGGGGYNSAGATGGSGVVILAHSNTSSNAIVSAGLTYTLNTTSRPGFLVYTFTAGTGIITWI